VIVDLGPAGKTRSAWPFVMPLVVAAIALGYVALGVLQRPDPAASARSRERVLAALAAPTAAATTAAIAPSRLLGPSVLAQRPPRPTLPPLLAVPAEIAASIPFGTADARREIRFTASDTSRPAVYRLPDGRAFVLQQTTPDHGRPVMVTYGLEEGTIRGHNAELFTSSVGPIRALVWWTEGSASYYLYSASVTIRELVRIAEVLR
jgi:hypothetical protein